MTTKARTYLYKADGRQFGVRKARAKDVLLDYQGKGNPWLWFSWEVSEKEGVKMLVKGAQTMREALAPINKICKITG